MERLVSFVAIRRYDYILKSGDVAEKGKIAFGDAAGLYVTVTPGAAPLGTFLTTLTGDGVKKVTILFWNEIFAYWFGNNANSIALANLFQTAFVADGVSVAASGTTALGIILDVDAAQGVLVWPNYPVPALSAGLGGA